jgi:hypothetical protein
MRAKGCKHIILAGIGNKIKPSSRRCRTGQGYFVDAVKHKA